MRNLLITSPIITKTNEIWLPDRSQVEDANQDVEGVANKFHNLITSLKDEVQARKLLLTALDQADKFYRAQRKDVKKVVYVSFDIFGKLIALR